MLMLKSILRLNATSCLVFGLIFIFVPESVGKFLSNNQQAPSLVFIFLGLGLLANSIHLIWASQQTKLSQNLILYFSSGDFLWVLGTAILIVKGLWITNLRGSIVSILVAIGVGTFGVLQLLKLQAREATLLKNKDIIITSCQNK